MKIQTISLIIIISLLLGVAILSARGFRSDEIPNGNKNSCQTCHTGFGGPRNDFGKQLFQRGFIVPATATGNVVWGPQIARLDADNDGVTNGEELGDPFGFWQVGKPAPGNIDFISQPGNALNKILAKLKIKVDGMNPHVGQKFELRVVNKSTGREVAQSTVASILNHDFDVEFENIVPGYSYWIDFYADQNKNGRYDAPPTDHAWRLEANNLPLETIINFMRHTNFVDINWKYGLNLQFAGMTPHVGQPLEMRVVDENSNREVGRTQLLAIPGASFTLSLPGILLYGQNFRIDFFADHNLNGSYDAPPVDHAYRLNFSNNTGDVNLNFTHNTNFTDINWLSLLTFQLGGMTPHVDQQLELRVVEQSTDIEIGRALVEKISVPEFIVTIPGILKGKAYRIDFYADHNKNGQYDAPPQDHAWRQLFTNNSGDVVLNFTHNLNFTDIQWPQSTAAENLDQNTLPLAFNLKQNFPNPFNPETQIQFSVPKVSRVRLEVLNLLGQSVRVLLNENLGAGQYDIVWNGLDDRGLELSAGVYLYRIQTSEFVQIRRMILLK